MKGKKLLSFLLATSMMAFALVGCSNQNGIGSNSENEKNTNTKVDKTYETDVIVVGGGGAGLVSALTAAENGKKVILLEKVGYLGGATLMSGGIIPAANTKQQQEAGIVDNIEYFARDIFRPNNYSVREDLVYTVTEKANGIVEWLEGLGVEFSLVTNSLYYGQSNYRMHVADGGGKGMTESIVKAVQDNPNITVMLNTPGVDLVVENDEVVGVYAENDTDGKIKVSAENTILATSGFAANKDMIEKYIPEMKNAYPLVAPGATGEGIQWGVNLGADVANMQAYQGHGVYSEELGGSVDFNILYRGGFLVNIDGERFTNEYTGYSELSPHVLAQPTSHVYMIFNEENAKKTAKFDTFKEAGIVTSADTIEELAASLNINKETLVKTVENFNTSIAKGEDEFNRTKLPTNFDGPYHAIKITADLRHTQGGLVTDVAGHVLKEDGSLIKGLYAAGGVTEGFSSAGGPGYMSGNGLLQAFVFGREAGLYAATETRSSAKVVDYKKPGSEENSTEAPTEEKEDTSTLTYKDGDYIGEGSGMKGLIKVKVTVEDGKVSKAEVTEQTETPEIYETCEDKILEGIVKNNGTSNVDAVTGATKSSVGIMNAVDQALSTAK